MCETEPYQRSRQGMDRAILRNHPNTAKVSIRVDRGGYFQSFEWKNELQMLKNDRVRWRTRGWQDSGPYGDPRFSLYEWPKWSEKLYWGMPKGAKSMYPQSRELRSQKIVPLWRLNQGGGLSTVSQRFLSPLRSCGRLTQKHRSRSFYEILRIGLNWQTSPNAFKIGVRKLMVVIESCVLQIATPLRHHVRGRHGSERRICRVDFDNSQRWLPTLCQSWQGKLFPLFLLQNHRKILETWRVGLKNRLQWCSPQK
jgi:hypothetical protein